MKSYRALLFLLPACALAQGSGMSPEQVVLERGPHHALLEVVSPGLLAGETNRIVELASGLNYLSETGEWVPASELIEAFPGGAVARQGQHKVIFANNLASAGAIDMELPDGPRFRTHVLGLAYLDPASGKHVLFAEVKDCQGEILPPNQVLYRDAFDGLQASVRFTYTRSSFEQDILVQEPLPAPEEFGLQSQSCVLQVLTEIVESPELNLFQRSAPLAAGGEAADTDIGLGLMEVVRGHAFAFPVNNTLQPVPTTKRIETMENRTFMVEELPLRELEKHLEWLGKTQGASLRTTPARKLVASTEWRLPARTKAPSSQSAMLLARAAAPTPALVLDYVTLNTSLTNRVFQSDETYYLSGDVALAGTNTVFEAGTVLKLNTNVTLSVRTPVTWLGKDYRPVFIVSRYDNTVGGQVTAGSPGSEYYGATALFFDASAANTNLVLQNLKVANARTAIAISGGSGHVLSHVQMVGCGQGLALTNTEVALRNALFDRVMTNFTGSSSTGRVEHLTSDTAERLSSGVTLYLTNSILAGITNLGSYTAESCTSASGPGGLFSTAGAGSHYLTEVSTNRNAGSATINPALAASLQKLTTYPPAVYSGLVVTSATTWAAQVQRDTDGLDRGFHYTPLDVLCSNVTLRALLSLSNGVGLGVAGTYGLEVQSGGSINSLGQPLRLNAVASYQNVQEQVLALGAGTTFLQSTSYCTLDFRFTEFSLRQGGRGTIGAFSRWTDKTMPERFAMRDCQARGSLLSVDDYYNTSPLATWTFGLTNNLFERSQLQFYHASSGYDSRVYLYNNTCIGGLLTWTYYNSGTNPNWQVRDNLFDRSGLTNTYDQGGSGKVQASNNGFTSGTSNPLGGSNNKTGLAADYQTGPLGLHYYPTNGGNLSQLIDAGSRYATNAGLYHFCTTTNSVKEAGTLVDIGWHQVALDATGQPTDVDGDGIPDIFEDLNGNGTVDSGETDWTAYNSPNGLTPGTGLTVFTPLKP